MVLTKCVVDGEGFVCDVSLTNGKIIIHNIHKDLLQEIKVSDIINLYREEDTLIIETAERKLYFSMSGTSSAINDIGRIVELRVRYAEFSVIINDLLLNTAKVFNILVKMTKEFHEEFVSRWVTAPQYIKELYSISKNLSIYDVDVVYYIDALNYNVERRNVNGVKTSIKNLIFNVTRLATDYMKTLLAFEDLTPLLNMLVLTYLVELANKTNQPLEAKKTEEDLLRICRTEIYVKMLNRPEVDVCRNFIEDLRVRGPYDSINTFLNNYMRLMEENIRKLLSNA
ncbi:MAG: hypothetical protein QXO98_00530 [Sulfolobales archaeon]